MARTAGGGLISATLALLPMTFLPSLALLSFFTTPLPLFLLGLGSGLRPLLGAGLLATVIIFVSQGLLPAAQFFILSVLGTAFLVHRALTYQQKPSGETVWYSPSFLLRDFILLSGLIMIFSLGVYLYLFQGKDIHTIVKIILENFDPHGNIAEGEELVTTLFPFFPGFFTLLWMLVMVLNGSVAQGFLTQIKANLRPTPSLKAIQLPHGFYITLGLSLLLSVIGVGTLELLGKNAALILAFPFFLTGLGIVHDLLHKTSFAKIGLTLFYCFLFLFPFLPALLVVFLGMLKPWIEKLSPKN